MSDPLDRIYERVLVLRCQAGDDAAFGELVERYSPRLRYYLRKMLADAAIDDALQEVWLDVFRGLGRLTDHAAFPAWLYRIAHGKACRAVQQAKAAPASLVEEDVVDPAPADDLTAEDAQRVHAALDRLPPVQREVLMLRLLEGMSYEEIAAATEAQVGTVRSRIHYGLKTLRKLLERSDTDGRARIG